MRYDSLRNEDYAKSFFCQRFPRCTRMPLQSLSFALLDPPKIDICPARDDIAASRRTPERLGELQEREHVGCRCVSLRPQAFCGPRPLAHPQVSLALRAPPPKIAPFRPEPPRPRRNASHPRAHAGEGDAICSIYLVSEVSTPSAG